MKKITLRNVLGYMVKKTRADREALCKGLCSMSTLKRYLRGEVKTDRLLLTVFMQRLGKSPDKFATLLNQEEYPYYVWKQRVSIAQVNKDWKTIEALLQEPEALQCICNEVLQKQFYLLLQGMVQERLYQNREKSVKFIQQAICLTVPDFPMLQGKKILLGGQEISALLLWQELQPKKELSLELLQFLLKYVEQHYQDMQERVKLYPRIAGSYLQLLYAREEYMECLRISEKAIQLMVETGYASHMERVLEIYVNAAEQLGMKEKIHERRVQLAAWKEMIQELTPQAKEEDEMFYMREVWQEVDLIDEVISTTRREQGYTQEDLSEDICAPETLSRIESGKRTPNKKNYAAITKKLGLREEFFYSDIQTADFGVLEEEYELRILLIQQKWEQAEEKLAQMISKLDMSDKYNRQYVEETQCIIDRMLERITLQEQYERLIETLSITKKVVSPNVEEWTGKFWLHYFTREEMTILMQLTDILYAQEKYYQVEGLLDNMIAYYRRSKVSIDFHYRTVLLIVGRLSSIKCMLGNNQEELDYSEEGIRISLASDNWGLLANFMNNKANALEKLGQKETSLQYYKLAFYCAELLGSNSAPVSKRSYEKLIGHEFKWY